MKVKLSKQEVLYLEYLLTNDYEYYDGTIDNPTIPHKQRIECMRYRKLIKKLLRKISV